MSKKIMLVGLTALCALAFGAISASGASAAGATAFTCVEGGGAHNTNSHCVPGSTGTFGHVAIPANTPTNLKLTGLGEQKLGSEVFGAEVNLAATGLSCTACTAENKEEGGEMFVTGTGGKLTYTGVTVVGLPECMVTEAEGGVNPGMITTEELKFKANTATSATIEPALAGSKVLAVFFISTATGTHTKECNIIGKYTVRGKVTGTVSGATLKAAVTKASGLLTLNNQKASLEGEATIEAGTGGTFHAASLTAT